MPDRLTDLVLGLQRMAEGARMRSDDLRYTQEQETYEHLQWLDQLLAMVDKVRSVLIEERQSFAPGPHSRPAQLPKNDLPNGRAPQPTQGTFIPTDQDRMPRVVAKGPREAAG